MSRLLPAEEIERRISISRQYASLPREERKSFLDTIGVSRSVISYWKVTYIDGYVWVPKPEKKPRKKAEPSYRIADITLSDRMRVISVVLEDRKGIQPNRAVSARAAFKAGGITDPVIAELADKCRAVLKEWGNRCPCKTKMCEHIKSSWR